MPSSPITIADSLSTVKLPTLRSSCEGCGMPRSSAIVILSAVAALPWVSPASMGYHEDLASPGGRGLVPPSTYLTALRPGSTLEVEPKAFVSSTSQTDVSPLPSGLTSTGNVQSRDNSMTVAVRKSQASNEAAQLKVSDPATGIFPVSSSDNPTSSIYQQNMVGSSFATPLSLDEWPQFDIWGPGIEFSSLSNDGRLPTLESTSVNHLSVSLDSPESHSCPRGSYELFRDLICPSPFLHAPETSSDTVSARLDEVLHFNRNAIDRLRQLLNCPCAKLGHKVMVHASIISRILIWYQQAAGSGSCESRLSALTTLSPPGSSPSSSPSRSEATADVDASRAPTLVQSTGFAVVKVPISMGSFRIEDENVQDAFRNQLILSELKKAANVIDLFTSYESGECSANGVANLYSHLGTWLRSEHLRTVRMLRARLSALDKTLDY